MIKSYIVEININNGTEPNLSFIGDSMHVVMSGADGKFLHAGNLNDCPSIHDNEPLCSIWTGWLIKDSKDEIIIWADPLGSLPLYYSFCHANNKLVISNYPDYLINNVVGKVEADPSGFWQALAFETPLRNKTIIKGIGQLGGGEKFTICHGGEPSITRYWKWRIEDPRYSSLSLVQCVDAACDLFDVSSRSLASSNTQYLLPLSGGPDSRLTAILASRNVDRSKILPVTYAYSTISREVGIAKQIVQLLQFTEHKFHKLTSKTYREAFNWMPSETGGLVGFANVHLMDYLRHSGFNGTIISSGWSDALCGYEAKSPVKMDHESWYSESHMQKWSETVEWLGIPEDINEQTRADLKFLADEWNNSTITSYTEYLYIVERHVKFHLPLLNLWGRYADVYTPFISNDLVNLFFSMPPEFRINKSLEHAVINRLSPEISALPSMSSLVLSGRAGNQVDRAMNRAINLVNVVLRGMHCGRLELPSPRITEQLAKAMHTDLRQELLYGCNRLEEHGLLTKEQKAKLNKPALRVGAKLGLQLSALNSSKVYSVER